MLSRQSFLSALNQLVILLWPLYLLRSVSIANVGDIVEYYQLISLLSLGFGLSEFGASLYGLKELQNKNHDGQIYSFCVSILCARSVVVVFVGAVIFLFFLKINFSNNYLFVLPLFVFVAGFNLEFVSQHYKAYGTLLVVRVILIASYFVFEISADVVMNSILSFVFVVFFPRVLGAIYLLSERSARCSIAEIKASFLGCINSFSVNLNSLVINSAFPAFFSFWSTAEVVAANAIISKVRIPAQFVYATLTPIKIREFLSYKLDSGYRLEQFKYLITLGGVLFLGTLIMFFGAGYVLQVVFEFDVSQHRSMLNIYLLVWVPVLFSHVYGLLGLYLKGFEKIYSKLLVLNSVFLFVIYIFLDSVSDYFSIVGSIFLAECILAVGCLFFYFKRLSSN
ncbi:hypothetical protein TDB9533_02309 [Thalassocella blandensis]|nr:hypothetical protein TDB9533_02309 [Thalassocella blandensis]